MKKTNTFFRTSGIGMKKILLIMKQMLFLLLVFVFQANAGNSQTSKISLDLNNASMTELIHQIEQQTGMGFIYKPDMLKEVGSVTLKVNNESVEDVLNKTLSQQGLAYEIYEQTIIITPATEKFEIPVDIEIKGKITDKDGDPLPGATVLVKGTLKGTTTDANGNYTLKVPEGSVLAFSFMGYQTQEIKVSPEKTEINVVMQQKAAELGEVVIKHVNTGYQKIRPEQSTGSISQISAKEFESQISSNFVDGLASRIPGLMINDDVGFTSTVDGEVTERSLFNIRGISTISGNQSPLIVVDGFPTELTLDMIDPYQVESVTVLKDAAAATVYGVRASNGVIVIERKGAKVGKPKIFFRSTLSIKPKENYSHYNYASNASELAVDYIRTLNPSIDSATYSHFYGYNGRYAQNPVYYILAQEAGNIISSEQAEEALAALGSYDNTEDYERLFLRSAINHTYNMDISGGSPNALYYLTFNYSGNRQSKINHENERILFSARTRINFTNRFSMELLTSYMNSNDKSAPVPGVNSAYRFEPYADGGGNPLSVTSGSVINPYYNTYLMSQGLFDHLSYPLIDAYHISDETHTVNNSFTANFKYDIGHGLNLTFGGIYESSRSDMQHHADEQSTEVRQLINNFVTLNTDGTFNYNIPVGAYLQETNSSTSTYTLRAQLDYNTKIGEHHSINAILGGEIRGVVTKGSTSVFFGYNDQTLVQYPIDYSSLGNDFVSSFMGSQSLYYPFSKAYQEDRYVSAYTNIVYSYRNTYSFTGSFRIDQSNLFGTNPKYRYKPLWSLGAAWNIHKENFMKDVSWLSELKLRMAYGFNGNVAKNSLPEVIAANYLNTGTSPASNALELYSLANSSLRWEQTRNFNIGLNFGLHERINGSIDYYTKRSTDILNNSRIAPSYGATSSLLNVATINNQGVELNLNADWISTPTFNWNTGFVLSRNTSKVLDVYEYTTDNLPAELNVRGYIPGYPVGALFAYRDGGLDDEGYPVVVDEEGNSYSTTSLSLSTTGLTYYTGSSIPTVNIGLSNRIDIGNFYVFCLVSYYGGFKVQVPRIRPGDPVTGSDNYWKQSGDEENTDIVGIEANNYYLTHHIYDNLDTYVVNGDYITLKTLTASYRFNDSKFNFLKKTGISQLELKLQASNIFTVGLNKYNYSRATGNYYKKFLTPTYTLGLLINF